MDQRLSDKISLLMFEEILWVLYESGLSPEAMISRLHDVADNPQMYEEEAQNALSAENEID